MNKSYNWRENKDLKVCGLVQAVIGLKCRPKPLTVVLHTLPNKPRYTALDFLIPGLPSMKKRGLNYVIVRKRQLTAKQENTYTLRVLIYDKI